MPIWRWNCSSASSPKAPAAPFVRVTSASSNAISASPMYPRASASAMPKPAASAELMKTAPTTSGRTTMNAYSPSQNAPLTISLMEAPG